VPNFIDRTIKAPDKELLTYTEVAVFLSMGAEDFRERVEEYRAYPSGSNPQDISQSLWRWDEVAGIIANLAWHERLYLQRKNKRVEQARERRRGRREKARTGSAAMAPHGRQEGAAVAPQRDKGAPTG
jgi:hypothetical protein